PADRTPRAIAGVTSITCTIRIGGVIGVATKRQTREERRAATRERLLRAARTVFARRGVQAATVDEIAEEAGFTTGALYSNFKGKGDLVLAVEEDMIAREIREYTEIFARG